MSLVCVGINHQLAPVDLRERLAVPEDSVAEVLDRVRKSSQLEECVIVSTCNRVEFYASAGAAPRVAACTERITGFVRDNVSTQVEAPAEVPLYTHEGINAARHLFRVASGLDSMVLGETEIFGQIKRAYHLAQRQGATRGALNRLFQSAFRVGKRVRSETDIQRGSTSVGSVAVDLAEKIFGKLDACRVLILGAGEISRTTTQSLASRGVQDITVANRSTEKALELAGSMGGRAVAFKDWPNCLNSIDIVLSSTSAAQYIVTSETIRSAMARRKGNPLFLIDLAVPRDIDPAIETLDNVYLYDIDALQSYASRARKLRERQIAICEQVIEEEAHEFFQRLGQPGR